MGYKLLNKNCHILTLLSIDRKLTSLINHKFNQVYKN